MINPRVWLCVAVWAVGTSCGSSDTAKNEFIIQYCELLRPCCAAAGLRSDGAQCQLFFGAFAPAGFNKSAGDACLAELRAMSSEPGFCESDFEPPSCKMAFPAQGGTKAPGETCEFDSDCALSTEGEVSCRTAFSSQANIRKCQIQKVGLVGSTPCAGTVDGNTTIYNSDSPDVPTVAYLCDLADGLRCDGTACVRLGAVGDACTYTYPAACVAGAFCDSGSRTCEARLPTGAQCAQSADECMAGDYCSTTQSCTPRLANGATCTESDQCQSDSCTNGKCEPSADFGLAFFCGEP